MEIHLYDSLHPMPSEGQPYTLPEENILQLLKLTPKQFEIVLKPSKPQPDGYNCGLFVVANAFELAHGYLPECAQYDVPRMRTHLKACLIGGKLTRFPPPHRT
jgi:Ulp1 family protease